MLLFLFGQDTYRLKQRINEVIDDYKKRCKSGLNFVKIDFKDKTLDDLKQVIETVSMFDEEKLVIIEDIFEQQEYFQKELRDYLEKKRIDINKDNLLVFYAAEAESKNELFKFLKKKAKVEEFNSLLAHKLQEWIKDYTKKQDVKIENQAIENIVEFVGSDLWRMSNELDKLISFKKSEIEAQDVELLVKPDIETDIFAIIDALGEKDKKRALRLVYDYFKKGEDEHYLLNRFVYQFRNLIKVKSGGGKDLHPFVFRKTTQQARNFSFEDLKKIYSKLLEIDLNTKTGKVDIKAALELFVAAL